MNLYSADVRIFATIYVKAESRRAAEEIIRQQSGNGIEVGESADISGLYFDNPDLPDISYSPAMTVGDMSDPQVALFIEEVD